MDTIPSARIENQRMQRLPAQISILDVKSQRRSSTEAIVLFENKLFLEKNEEIRWFAMALFALLRAGGVYNLQVRQNYMRELLIALIKRLNSVPDLHANNVDTVTDEIIHLKADGVLEESAYLSPYRINNLDVKELAKKYEAALMVDEGLSDRAKACFAKWRSHYERDGGCFLLLLDTYACFRTFPDPPAVEDQAYSFRVLNSFVNKQLIDRGIHREAVRMSVISLFCSGCTRFWDFTQEYRGVFVQCTVNAELLERLRSLERLKFDDMKDYETGGDHESACVVKLLNDFSNSKPKRNVSKNAYATLLEMHLLNDVNVRPVQSDYGKIHAMDLYVSPDGVDDRICLSHSIISYSTKSGKSFFIRRMCIIPLHENILRLDGVDKTPVLPSEMQQGESMYDEDELSDGE
jgi:hypothetical protein